MHNLNIPAELFRTAHQHTSFTPEARGDRERAGHEAQLAADLESMRAEAAAGGTTDLLPAEFARYVSGYSARLSAYLASASRCASSMITGPARFPVERMRKRADVAHKRMQELTEYRERALAAMRRTLRPELRPVMSGDADAPQRLAAKIAEAEREQQTMRDANAAIRKHKAAGPEAQCAALMALGFPATAAAQLLKPDFAGRVGFADYRLTNNSANIRRMRQRLEQVTAAQAAPVTTTETAANGVRLEDDPPANRVRLYFPGKPDETTRAALKKNGFRWAPSLGAWQAYRNTWSLQHARAVASA